MLLSRPHYKLIDFVIIKNLNFLCKINNDILYGPSARWLSEGLEHGIQGGRHPRREVVVGRGRVTNVVLFGARQENGTIRYAQF